MIQRLTGPMFKVIDVETGAIVAEFHTRKEAQAEADVRCALTNRNTHFDVVKIEWVGSSKRLSDVRGG